MAFGFTSCGEWNVADENLIWLGQNGQKYGPYTEANLLQWLKEGKVAPDALAWRNGMADWLPLASLLPAAATGTPLPPPLAASEIPPPSRATGTPEPFSVRRAESHDAAASDRANLPTPPSLHWALVWLFTILTLGIFGIIWPFVQANWVRKIDAHSNAPLLVGLATAGRIAGYGLYFIGLATMAQGGRGLLGLGGLLLLAGWVLFLVAYFSMAGTMRDKLDSQEVPLEIGGVTLFFFTMYYLQAQLSWIARWKRTGRTSPAASKGALWAVFCLVPFALSILAAIAIPAYQDYLVRTQVSEGVVLADGARTAMAEYYSAHGAFPPDNPSAGLAQSTSIAGRYVSSVDVAGGRVTVAYATAAANRAVRDKVLVFTPSADHGSIHWECSSNSTVPPQDLPASCRQ